MRETLTGAGQQTCNPGMCRALDQELNQNLRPFSAHTNALATELPAREAKGFHCFYTIIAVMVSSDPTTNFPIIESSQL